MKQLHIKRPVLRLPVWKGPRLSRKTRIVRNLLLSVLSAAVLYAAMDFPPYTVDAMMDRMRRNYLMPDLEPVYVLEDSHTYSDDHFPGRHYTYIIARSGEDYLAFQYDTHLWSSELFVARSPVLSEGSFCAARIGVLYAAAPAMANAATATAAVETLTETFVLEGERLSGEVFSFPYRNGTGPDLSTAVDFAYLENYQSGPNGYSYSLEKADIPVTVTLYDDAGRIQDTLSLTVSTYDINSWY